MRSRQRSKHSPTRSLQSPLASQAYAECFPSIHLIRKTSFRSTTRYYTDLSLRRICVDRVLTSQQYIELIWKSRQIAGQAHVAASGAYSSAVETWACKPPTDFCGDISDMILDNTIPDADKRVELEGVMEVSISPHTTRTIKWLEYSYRSSLGYRAGKVPVPAVPSCFRILRIFAAFLTISVLLSNGGKRFCVTGRPLWRSILMALQTGSPRSPLVCSGQSEILLPSSFSPS